MTQDTTYDYGTDPGFADPAGSLGETPVAPDGHDADPEDDADTSALDGLTDPDGDGEDGSDGEDAGRAGGARSQKDISRAAIRRIAAKAEEVAETPDKVRALAAKVLGSTDTVTDLTTAIMLADRAAAAALTDLKKIVAETGENEMTAMVTVIDMKKERVKAVWSLLEDLGVEKAKKSLPASDAKAGMQVVQTVKAVDPASLAPVDDVLVLLRKRAK